MYIVKNGIELKNIYLSKKGEVSPSLQLALSTIFKIYFENHLSYKKHKAIFRYPLATQAHTAPFSKSNLNSSYMILN